MVLERVVAFEPVKFVLSIILKCCCELECYPFIVCSTIYDPHYISLLESLGEQENNNHLIRNIEFNCDEILDRFSMAKCHQRL